VRERLVGSLRLLRRAPVPVRTFVTAVESKEEGIIFLSRAFLLLTNGGESNANPIACLFGGRRS
jgi:hypothetical protein